jgi:hypothetical protein
MKFNHSYLWISFLLVFSESHSQSQGKVQNVNFSPNQIEFSDSIVVELQCSTPGAEIYYSINDKLLDTALGIKYTGPLLIKATTYIEAAAYKSGMQPSDFVSRQFTKSATGLIRIPTFRSKIESISLSEMHISVLGRTLKIKQLNDRGVWIVKN